MSESIVNALELHNVSRSFGDFSLQNVSLTLPSGCILGLIGENGAGKSTTIRLILDALRRDSGDIRVLGMDNRDPGFRALKEDIGVVLDEAYFPETLNVTQLSKVLSATYSQWDQAVFDNYLCRFELPQKRAFKDFSRGMKMKLAIAAALSHHPRLLILDEATSGLDPIVRDDILGIFSDFTRDEGHSILISSHILSDLEKLCDYVAFLHQGKLLFSEEKDRLLDEYGILVCTAEELSALPDMAFVSAERSDYGTRALVRKSAVPDSAVVERATIEDIILFLVKGDKTR